MIEKRIASLVKKLEKENSPSTRYTILKKLTFLNFSYNSFSKCRDYAQKALECAAPDSLLNRIKLHYWYGTSLYHTGLYDKSVEIFRFIENAPPKKTTRYYLAASYVALASLYSQLNDHTIALEHAQKALDVNATIEDIRQKARIYNVFSIIYNAMGEYDTALEWLFNGLEIIKGQNFYRSEAMFYNNIGYIYRQQQNYEKALDYYMIAMSVKTNDPTPYSLAVSLYNIGYVCAQLGQYQEAYAYYEKSLSHALISADMAILELIYKDFSSLCEQINDYPRAYDFFKKYTAVRSEVYSNERTRKLSDMKNKFEIDKKKREAEIYRLESIEIADAQKKLLQQNKELMRINNSKDQILNIVSHDLKNSIGSISSILTLIPPQDDAFFNTCLQMINDTTNKSLDLVQSILTASKIDMDSFNLTLVPVSMKQFFADHTSLIKLMADKKHIRMLIIMPDNDIKCAIDAQRFWEIVSNLVSNAVKFTSENGEVSIRGKEKKDTFTVSIKDNGIGIPKNLLKNIFDKFTIARRNGTNGEPTTGLGLSIVKRLTELHKGSIHINSRDGEGTTVTISIPIHT